MIALTPNKNAEAMKQVILNVLTALTTWVKTLTYDNGKEFELHEDIADVVEAKGDFVHPYRSWESGLNENTNGLIRHYIPKGASMDGLTPCEASCIMDSLNNRLRKCLGFRILNQVLFGIDPPIVIAR